jgi:hypothetical protein
VAFTITEIPRGTSTATFNGAREQRVFRVTPAFGEFAEVESEFPWPSGGSAHPRVTGVFVQSRSVNRFAEQGYNEVVFDYAPFEYADTGPAFDPVNNALNPTGNWSVQLNAGRTRADVLSLRSKRVRSAIVEDAAPTFAWEPSTESVSIPTQTIRLIAAKTYPRVSVASVPDALSAFQATAVKVNELHNIGGLWVQFAGANVRQDTEQDTTNPRWTAQYEWVYDPGVVMTEQGDAVYLDEDGTPNAVGVDGPGGYLYPYLPNVLNPLGTTRYSRPPYSQVFIRESTDSAISRPIFGSRLLFDPSNANGYQNGLFIVNGVGA